MTTAADSTTTASVSGSHEHGASANVKKVDLASSPWRTNPAPPPPVSAPWRTASAQAAAQTGTTGIASTPWRSAAAAPVVPAATAVEPLACFDAGAILREIEKVKSQRNEPNLEDLIRAVDEVAQATQPAPPSQQGLPVVSASTVHSTPSIQEMRQRGPGKLNSQGSPPELPLKKSGDAISPSAKSEQQPQKKELAPPQLSAESSDSSTCDEDSMTEDSDYDPFQDGAAERSPETNGKDEGLVESLFDMFRSVPAPAPAPVPKPDRADHARASVQAAPASTAPPPVVRPVPGVAGVAPDPKPAPAPASKTRYEFNPATQRYEPKKVVEPPEAAPAAPEPKTGGKEYIFNARFKRWEARPTAPSASASAPAPAAAAASAAPEPRTKVPRAGPERGEGYKTRLCANFLHGDCVFGPRCTDAHSQQELRGGPAPSQGTQGQGPQAGHGNGPLAECEAIARDDVEKGLATYPQALAVRLALRFEERPAAILRVMTEAGLPAAKDQRSTVKAIMRLCHPDKCKHPEAKRAAQVLARLLS